VTAWTPTTVEPLLAALDLAPDGPDRFIARPVASSRPTLSSSQLLAWAVVAAERSLPGYSVRHLSCVFARAARPDRPTSITVSELQAGRSFASARISMSQTDHPGEQGESPDGEDDRAAHCEAVVLLGVDQAPVGRTAQRALLACLSEPLSLGDLLTPEPGIAGGPGYFATVLAQSITFGAPFDLTDSLLVRTDSPETGGGQITARAVVRTLSGAVVATVSQAGVVREL
jgi:acyl-CoA thioesterase